MIASLTEETDAINWYQQRISVEPDAEARAIMTNAQHEEFKHFGMDLEFLLRRTPIWRIALQRILFTFTQGNIIAQGEQAEDSARRRCPMTHLADKKTESKPICQTLGISKATLYRILSTGIV